jgi:hypothetical protein
MNFFINSLIAIAVAFSSFAIASPYEPAEIRLAEIKLKELNQLKAELAYLQRQVKREHKLITEGSGALSVGFLMINGTQFAISYLAINNRNLEVGAENSFYGFPAAIGKVAGHAEVEGDSLRIWLNQEQVNQLAVILEESLKMIDNLQEQYSKIK